MGIAYQQWAELYGESLRVAVLLVLMEQDRDREVDLGYFFRLQLGHVLGGAPARL